MSQMDCKQFTKCFIMHFILFLTSVLYRVAQGNPLFSHRAGVYSWLKYVIIVKSYKNYNNKEELQTVLIRKTN